MLSSEKKRRKNSFEKIWRLLQLTFPKMIRNWGLAYFDIRQITLVAKEPKQKSQSDGKNKIKKIYISFENSIIWNLFVLTFHSLTAFKHVWIYVISFRLRKMIPAFKFHQHFKKHITFREKKSSFAFFHKMKLQTRYYKLHTAVFLFNLYFLFFLFHQK